jgi:hypothetical protein
LATINVSAEKIVHAPPRKVFALLYDYEMGHWRVLPKAFSNYRVLKPGPGGRTHIACTLNVAGTQREVEAEVSVPKRDRMIVETDLERGTKTTFTIDPIGPDSRVRIETTWEQSMVSSARSSGGWPRGFSTRSTRRNWT